MSQFTIIKPNTNIQFIGHRKPVMAVLFILAILSLILTFVVGPNWGTSFAGGTSITMHFNQYVGPDEVRTVFVDDPRFESVSVQSVGTDTDKPRYIVRTRTTTTLKCADMDNIRAGFAQSIAAKTNQTMTIGQWPACNPEIEDGIRGDFFVTLVPAEGQTAPETPMAPEEVHAQLQAAGLDAEVAYEENLGRYTVKPSGIQHDVVKLLNDSFGDKFDEASGVDEIVTVGADVGDKFRSDAIVSIIMALGLMLLYIGIRFDARYAPAAVFSLAVSTLIAWGIVIVLNLEITLETVAAFLTLVGYGVNDTIVNFDRIRENIGLSDSKTSLPDIVNKSINDCLSRTTVTSGTTLFAVIPLAVIGSGTTRDFAIIMTFGIIITTINSIYVSCPGMIFMDEWFKKMSARNAAKEEIESAATP